MAATVGQLVRQAREAQGLTLAAVAQRAGIAKAYLSMIENHRVAPPSAKVLTALARVLQLPKGTLQAAAQWQTAPPLVKAAVAQQAQAVDQARQLARWLLESTSRKAGGGRNLDRLFRSGELRKRIAETLPPEAEASEEAPQPRNGRDGDAAAPMARQPSSSGRAGLMAGIPLINKVAAGYPSHFTDLEYPARVADETIVCPDVGDPDAFAARVVGESMAPDYREGDIVVFSPLADVADGCDCFVRLEPDHDTTFKRVFFEGPKQERIRLMPLNPRFTARTYARDEVAGLYRAVWSMRRV